MITIITHNPEFINSSKIKYWVKKLIKKSRGPEFVLKNIILGLERINYKFSINKKPKHGDKLHVISDIDALKWAIKQKELGKISELIAGPNILVTPKDHNSIITNKNIDKVIVVSKWTAEFFLKMSPELAGKIYIWPAGTECNINTNTTRDTYLLYKKYTEEKLFDDIKKYLEDNHMKYELIEYGKYKPKDYYEVLSRSKLMIYLQESESQGIALQEAWAHNVPTFVWNKELDFKWNNAGYVIDPEKGLQIKIKSSAPYLTEESGKFFKDYDEFVRIFPDFINNLNNFTPAKYCKENLSLEKSAEIYVNIIENKEQPFK